MQKEENICAVCNAAAKQRCSGCQEVFYCGRSHQKLDWKIHSKNCQPIKLVVDSKIGRHYVATRDIKVGVIVLRENAPLVTGPPYGMPACLSCYDKLTADNVTPCCKCGLPLCDRCTKHGAECEFTMKYRKTKVRIPNYDSPQDRDDKIAVVRALSLRETNPEAYRKLLKKEDHSVLRSTKPNRLVPPMEIARCVKAFFDYEDVGLAEIARIAGIVQINAYEVPVMKPYIAVYDKASYLEHNCRPNCSMSFTINGGVVFWAAVPIFKGEHITVSYVNFRLGTIARRLNLMTTKFFHCECERCKDPTEFETMYSLFKCITGDCAGFMIPPTFLTPNHKLPNYVCNNCGETKSLLEIQEMEMQVCQKIATLKDDDHVGKLSVLSQSKILHENHYLYFITVLKFALDTITYDEGTLGAFSDKILTELIQHSRQLINLVEILQPGEHELKASLLLVVIRISDVLHNRRTRNFVEWTAYITERKQSCEKICELLRFEPEPSTGHELRATALSEINRMQASEQSLYERYRQASGL